MSDIKDVLPIVCKYINSLIDISLTPEHLRLAKYNVSDKNAAEMLWNTLHILSYYAAREKRSDIDFQNYDTLLAVKLHLAFLQYPAIEFYSLSRNSDRNRDLLIALGWLLGTQDVVTIALRIKLTNSALGTECSYADLPKSVSLIVPNNQSLSTNAWIDNILHMNAKVNLNLREITELINERGSLISKVHAASIDVSGLPHLSVSELALIKRLTTTNRGGNSAEEDRRRLREFHDAGILLNGHAKWLRKRHVFLDWMTTVIQEHRKYMESSNSREIDSRELATFNSLLYRIIKDKLRIFTSEEMVDGGPRNSVLDCSSRMHRSQCNNIEAQTWLNNLNERQNREEENLQQNRKRLANELKEMLKLIPSVIRI